jgi:hypothetical protein
MRYCLFVCACEFLYYIYIRLSIMYVDICMNAKTSCVTILCRFCVWYAGIRVTFMYTRDWHKHQSDFVYIFVGCWENFPTDVRVSRYICKRFLRLRSSLSLSWKFRALFFIRSLVNIPSLFSSHISCHFFVRWRLFLLHVVLFLYFQNRQNDCEILYEMLNCENANEKKGLFIISC